MTTIPDAVKKSNALWKRGGQVLRTRSGSDRREPLELALAALLYQRWALDGFTANTFHQTIRTNPVTMAQFATGNAAPLKDRNHVGATMHLASASMRLPTAVARAAAGTSAQRRSDFDGLYTGGLEPWPRALACKYLDQIGRLGHCSGSIALPLAIVAMLLFRDEFGHGEEGAGEEHWRRDRKAALDGLHRCRVVEAQQQLATWVFSVT